MVSIGGMKVFVWSVNRDCVCNVDVATFLFGDILALNANSLKYMFPAWSKCHSSMNSKRVSPFNAYSVSQKACHSNFDG